MDNEREGDSVIETNDALWLTFEALAKTHPHDPDVRMTADLAKWLLQESQRAQLTVPPIMRPWHPLLEWATPFESGKARVIAIGRNPFTPRLNRERCEPGILCEIAVGLCDFAQILEDRPMSVARGQDGCVRLPQHDRTEIERLGARAWMRENPTMRGDTNQTGEDLRCHTVSRRTLSRPSRATDGMESGRRCPNGRRRSGH